jgi:hypothetical protein
VPVSIHCKDVIAVIAAPFIVVLAWRSFAEVTALVPSQRLLNIR